ncbi:nitrile hydratase [Aureococcus anophagefferens]|nr:nitrile hydratase [Aureococcus anophagefferens]
MGTTPSTWKSTTTGCGGRGADGRRPRAKGHAHGSQGDAEAAALDEEDDDGPGRRLMNALAAALVENGVVTRGELRDAVERIDALGVAAAGPRLVARAWVDDGFRKRLLEDATAAAAELGIAAANATAPTVLTALENTDGVHNLVVCTLCSCAAGWAEADLAALVTRDAMIGVAAPRAPPG